MSEIDHNKVPIADVEFSVKTTNCLLRAGLRTLGDVTSQSERELLKLPNFGRRCAAEVKEMLGSFGLSLREGPVLTLEQQMQSALSRARFARQAYEQAVRDIQRIGEIISRKAASLPEVD